MNIKSTGGMNEVYSYCLSGIGEHRGAEHKGLGTMCMLLATDACYGGNIGAMAWKMGNETKTRGYQFVVMETGTWVM